MSLFPEQKLPISGAAGQFELFLFRNVQPILQPRHLIRIQNRKPGTVVPQQKFCLGEKLPPALKQQMKIFHLIAGKGNRGFNNLTILALVLMQIYSGWQMYRGYVLGG